ncbi:MAG: cation transporter, partial [Mesorhizobium sp.]
TEMPEITRLFVKPQTTGTWVRRRKLIDAASDPALD